MNNRRLARLALPAALCVPLLSHALDETPLSMVFEPLETPTSRKPNIPAGPTVQQEPAAALFPAMRDCRVAVRHIEDIRPSKQTVGGLIVPPPPVAWAVPMIAVSARSGDGRAWLQGGMQSLATTAGLQLPAAAPQEGVDVALRMAQTWIGGMNIHSHVVLQASFPGAGAREARRYHGFASKLNMNGANSEYMATLNMGMVSALQQFAQDLQRACNGLPLQDAGETVRR